LAHPGRGRGSLTGHADGHIGRGSSGLLLLLGLAEPGLEGEDERHPGSALEDPSSSGDLAASGMLTIQSFCSATIVNVLHDSIKRIAGSPVAREHLALPHVSKVLSLETWAPSTYRCHRHGARHGAYSRIPVRSLSSISPMAQYVSGDVWCGCVLEMSASLLLLGGST
jgi:hypothetical protein